MLNLTSLKVHQLDRDGNIIKTWNVPDEVPTLPSWAGTLDYYYGNMRIDATIKKAGTSSNVRFDTQTVGVSTGLKGELISTPEVPMQDGDQYVFRHWIRMWSENIRQECSFLEDGNITLQTVFYAHVASFSFHYAVYAVKYQGISFPSQTAGAVDQARYFWNSNVPELDITLSYEGEVERMGNPTDFLMTDLNTLEGLTFIYPFEDPFSNGVNMGYGAYYPASLLLFAASNITPTPNPILGFILAHEIGHGISLPHCSDLFCIMNDKPLLRGTTLGSQCRERIKQILGRRT